MPRKLARVIRVAWNGAAALSLVLCVGVYVLWAAAKASPWQSVRHEVTRQGPVVREQYRGFGWDPYGVAFRQSEWHYLDGAAYDEHFRLVGSPTTEDYATAASLERDIASRGPPGLDVRGWRVRYYDRYDRLRTIGSANRRRMYQRSMTVVVPFYLLALTSAALPAARLGAWWRRWWRERATRRAGLCPACGYDLTGNVSGTCPECGTPVTATTTTTPPPPADASSPPR